MAKEIERKFLVSNDSWRVGAQAELFVQGYLSREHGRTVRVRVASTRAYLTIKGERDHNGLSRNEFEYAIPLADAETLLTMCEKPLIQKTRHRVLHHGLTWEVDEFLGENSGLVVAEIELDSPDQKIVLPSWVGDEVTDDPRYANSMLTRHPYSRWHI